MSTGFDRWRMLAAIRGGIDKWLVAYGSVLVLLVAMCVGGIVQAAAISDLRDRVETVESRVTESNLKAWAPWSRDVTERLERIERLIKDLHT